MLDTETLLSVDLMFTIADNVKVLCAVWDLMHYTFNLAQMLIKGTKAEFTTSAHIAQNTCYRLAGFSAQLNECDVKEIKTLLAKGFNCTYISELYSVHRKTINDIKLQKTWK